MKKPTIALITGVTLLALHGSHVLWGLRGLIGVVAVVAVFYVIARTLYWRRLRRLQGLDPEARRDMEKLVQNERKSARHRR